jgi:fucose 4-O-acetylase-like acetyltransferase
LTTISPTKTLGISLGVAVPFVVFLIICCIAVYWRREGNSGENTGEKNDQNYGNGGV